VDPSAQSPSATPASDGQEELTFAGGPPLAGRRLLRVVGQAAPILVSPQGAEGEKAAPLTANMQDPRLFTDDNIQVLLPPCSAVFYTGAGCMHVLSWILE
jgi:hypothetical protein